MSDANFRIPTAVNEPLLSYAPDTNERKLLKDAIQEMQSTRIELPMIIGSERVMTTDRRALSQPHKHAHTLGYFHYGEKKHAELAIETALAAKHNWEKMPWHQRAAIFLKTADLISTKYRYKMMAATMLGQSKNVYQAEIDCIAELVDFLRFNVQFTNEIYSQQPISSAGIWNKVEYRPLEGFVFAITPFNFTAIAGNLCTAPAMLGNVVVWKPSDTQIYAAHLFMEILLEAGLPAGVVNLIYGDGPTIGDIVFNHKDFAGLHFTGSTVAFQSMYKTIGANISNYKTYPRIVGETGGKDFIVVHNSADVEAVVTGMIRGAFEFQGQKCSAASRAYVPQSLWAQIKAGLIRDFKSIKMGSTEDFSNFVNAVIDARSFQKIKGYLDYVKSSPMAEIICGGNADDSIGYFIEPTVVVTTNPRFKTMEEEIFGPVLTIYVYEDAQFEHILELTDTTSNYALTGAIFAQSREVIAHVTERLRHSAGNFYINDKPTGAVVGQQPFGGARASGTNDKAGSILNLYRWVSARTIKETLVSPTNYRYPFLMKE